MRADQANLRKGSAMTYTSTAPTAEQSGEQQQWISPERTGWVGFIVFASIMMMLIGFFQGIVGLAALFKDEYFLVSSKGLLVSVDYTAWGWTHIVLGVLTLAAAAGILSGKIWARAWGIVMAMIGVVVSLGFLAAYPIWSAILITLEVLVIWSLAVHGRETRPA
jgi:hypothetical protein